MKFWDDEYGNWQGLASPEQAPRYQLIVDVIDRFCPKGSVLDVGCGEAVLLDYLAPNTIYFGIEPSAKAVEGARTRGACDCIRCTMAEDFEDDGRRWDCIVFNEVLYYTKNPCALLTKYARLVKGDGIIIVSIFQRPGHSIKAQLLHWLEPSRPISNLHCGTMVHKFILREGWPIQEDKLVPIPGTRVHWRIWVMNPRRAKEVGIFRAA